VLHLEIVTPKGSVVDVQADAVTLPGKLGEFGVLIGHIPFLSALRPGVLRYTVGDKQHRLAVASGFAEVGASSRVLVLTDQHAFPAEIDVDEAKRELADVEAELKAWVGEMNAEHDILRDRAEWAQARLAAK
jgi:F-type H+-transporting ATPase subunit epsilon